MSCQEVWNGVLRRYNPRTAQTKKLAKAKINFFEMIFTVLAFVINRGPGPTSHLADRLGADNTYLRIFLATQNKRRVSADNGHTQNRFCNQNQSHRQTENTLYSSALIHLNRISRAAVECCLHGVFPRKHEIPIAGGLTPSLALVLPATIATTFSIHTGSTSLGTAWQVSDRANLISFSIRTGSTSLGTSDRSGNWPESVYFQYPHRIDFA